MTLLTICLWHAAVMAFAQRAELEPGDLERGNTAYKRVSLPSPQL
jgi:hypothetical protein